MIVFELRCDRDHRFEGWFASGDDFDAQHARGLVTCPTCASAAVSKVPSSRIRRAEPERTLPVPAAQNAPVQQPPRTPEEMQRRVMAFIEHVMKNSEDVGKNFPEEARKIHREEAPERAIRGVATREETEELLDEGVPILPLPVPPRGDLH
jgi:hypothetical protein